MPQASVSSSAQPAPAGDLHNIAEADVGIPPAPQRGQLGTAGADTALADTPEAAANRLRDATELSAADFAGADAADNHAGRLSWKDALPLLIASAAGLWVLIVAIVWTVTAS